MFQNGGNIQSARISGATAGQSIQTPTNTAARTAFNPFTTIPVEGVNWAKTAAFGTAVNRFSFDSPRTFRITFGVRF